ncbi:hypothetical protein OIU79_006119, partial [Salix purpurea]
MAGHDGPAKDMVHALKMLKRTPEIPSLAVMFIHCLLPDPFCGFNFLSCI